MATKSNSFFWLVNVKKIFSPETTWPNGAKLGRKHLCKVLYKVSSFGSVWPTNMAAKSNSCFWLANVKQIFSPETPSPNGTKLGRKHLCKILYKASSYGSIWPTNMATKSNSCFWLATVKKIFSSETTWLNGGNLVRKHLCKVLYKVSSFRSVLPTNMAAKSNSCFWLANVKQIFSPETPSPNGTKLGRKHLFRILYKASSYGSIWPTNMATKSNSFFWLVTVNKTFSSETAWPNGAKLGRKHLCKVLYKVSSFRSVWPANMAAKSNSCFWLANVKQIFSSETP